MSVVSAPSREPCPRVSLSTSVLIVMLLSLPMSAEIRGVRAMAEQMSGLRVGLAPHQALPVEIARRLYDGIRYELPAGPAPTTTPAEVNFFRGETTALSVTPLREALLDLPPPASA